MTPKETQERARIVATARSWIGTPFHQGGQVKQAGCDCGTLLYSVFREGEVIPEGTIELFAQDWFVHESRERYLLKVLRWAKHMKSIVPRTNSALLPGTIILTKTGPTGVFNHGAIVTEWPNVVHAGPEGVEEVDTTQDEAWANAEILVLDTWAKKEEDGNQ